MKTVKKCVGDLASAELHDAVRKRLATDRTQAWSAQSDFLMAPNPLFYILKASRSRIAVFQRNVKASTDTAECPGTRPALARS